MHGKPPSNIIYRVWKEIDQKKNQQGVQGLQAFAFCVVTVNDEHAKPRFKRKLKG